MLRMSGRLAPKSECKARKTIVNISDAFSIYFVATLHWSPANRKQKYDR